MLTDMLMNMPSEYDRDKYVYGRVDRHVRSFNLQRLGREIQGGYSHEGS